MRLFCSATPHFIPVGQLPPDSLEAHRSFAVIDQMSRADRLALGMRRGEDLDGELLEFIVPRETLAAGWDEGADGGFDSG